MWRACVWFGVMGCMAMVIACQSEASRKQDASQAVSVKPEAPQSLESFPDPRGDSKDLDMLVRGKTRAEIQARYGAPQSTYEFKLADGVPEFRVELLNDFHPDSPEFETKVIIEHTYHYPDDNYHAVVWYHEVDDVLIALQAMSWDDAVEF